MSPESIEVQIQKMSEQLELQAEAITKLVELVSNLDGLDAGPLKSYALRLQRVHPDIAAAHVVEAPPDDGLLAAETAPS